MSCLTHVEAGKSIQRELEDCLPELGVLPAHEGTPEQFVRDCYVDILFRCPSPGELAAGLRELRAGKTREAYRYALASVAAPEEACLNRPLAAALRAKVSVSKRRARCPAGACSELLRLLDDPADDRLATIQTIYRAILRRPAAQAESDGWMALQERGLGDVAMLWAIVHCEERLQRNLPVPAGTRELIEIARKGATFAELMLLQGNAFLELGCQMFLKREARADEKTYYFEQIVKDWSPSDALWRTISRKTTANFRHRKRLLWKSVCHPLTIGCWHFAHLMQFHRMRRTVAQAFTRPRRDPTHSAQTDAILSAIAELRQSLGDPRQHGLGGGQSAAISRSPANVPQQQESCGSQSETICRALADLERHYERLASRTEAICQSMQLQENEQGRLAAGRRRQGQLVSDNVILVEHPYHGVFGVPAENWGFVRMFTFADGFERGTMNVLASLCQEGMTAVDIGAHVGLQSLVLAKRVGPRGSVYCFEPCERSCKILRNNLFINGYENAHVRQMAVSDTSETCKFFVHDRELTWSSLYPLADAASCTEISVETTRLDDAIPNDVKVDLVKIDAEGAELNILNGMTRIIARNPKIQIIVEYGPVNIARTGKRPEELLARIRELGFSIRCIDETTGELSPATDEGLRGVYSINLLLSK